LNDRGNLPLHAACSFQATPEVVQALLRAYPGGSSQPNGAGNLPIHQAAMWQAPLETVELLLSRYPEGATVRNQYGSLPLHMAASNQAAPETVRLLIDSYPDALHLQNDDGMTPLDLALADEGASEAIIAMLEGRPPPPEMTRRQQAEKLDERAAALERKLSTLGDAGGRQNRDLTETLLAVRRLADRFPHALYSAGIDPNELEHGLSEHMMEQDDKRGGHSSSGGAEAIILDFVKRRSQPVIRDSRGGPMAVQSIRTSAVNPPVPRDRIEDLLASVVGLDHIKSQVSEITQYFKIICASLV
jgi:ankyrin repeat protein